MSLDWIANTFSNRHGDGVKSAFSRIDTVAWSRQKVTTSEVAASVLCLR